ncbi:uncharacterized protein LOC121735688 [Aricia agestis]|uniref:uncharacterized protein LOC121735688 n=1 Tax=Aricia agestis TaxID=91739 RepID=UPI001C20491E|nr:uncharacterized protein LOC121735688 [Aricia agestis]
MDKMAAALLVLAVLSLLHEGLAINCYQCNSHNDSRCLMDKLPDSLRLPCGPKDTMCRKISQVVEFEMNGMPPDSRVIRGCGWDETSYKGRCYQRSGFGGRQEVCSCLEDGCNSATVPIAATALMLLTVAILRFCGLDGPNQLKLTPSVIYSIANLLNDTAGATQCLGSFDPGRFGLGRGKMYSYGLLLFIGLVEYGSAIVCYECNSALNSMCANAVLPDSLKRNCSEHDRGVTHTLCRKIIQHVDHEVNGQLPTPRVIRSCGWDESKYKGSCYHRSGYGGHQEVCSCVTNLCNNSTQTTINIAFIIISIIAFFVSNKDTYCCSWNIEASKIQQSVMADRSNADKLTNWSHLEPIGTGAKKKIVKSQDKQNFYNSSTRAHERGKENVDIDRPKRLQFSSESASSLDYYAEGEKMVSDLCTIPDANEGTFQKRLSNDEREQSSGPSDYFLTALDKINSLDQIPNRIVQLAIEACTDAENIAISHHNRPCFKNIHSICAKTRSNVQKADSAVANLHSQGIPWVIKNFIFSFVRILDGWKGVKELLSEKHDTYARIENKYYSENIRECFVQWQAVTEEMLAHIYKTFKCLDHGFKLEQKSFTQNYYATNPTPNRHQNQNKFPTFKSHTCLPRAASTSPAPYNALQPPWVQSQMTNTSQNIPDTQWSNRPGVSYKKIPVLTTSSQSFYSSNDLNDYETFQKSQPKCDVSNFREAKPRQSWTITNADFRAMEGIYQTDQRELYSQLKQKMDAELGKVPIPPIFNSMLSREMEIKAKMIPLSHVEKTLIPSMATTEIRGCYMPKNNSCGDTKDDTDFFATWGQMIQKERSEFIAHHTHNAHVPNNTLNISNTIAGPIQYFENEHDECYEISKVYMKPGSYKVPIKSTDLMPPFATNSLQDPIDLVDDSNYKSAKPLLSPVVLAPQPKYNLESWPCLVPKRSDELNEAQFTNISTSYLDVQKMDIQNSMTSDRAWEAAKQSAPKLIDSKNEDSRSDTARLYNALGLAGSDKSYENYKTNFEIVDDDLMEASNIVTTRNTQKIWCASVHNISQISKKDERENEECEYEIKEDEKVRKTSTRCSNFDQCGNCIKDTNQKKNIKTKTIAPGTWYHAKKKQPLSMFVVKKFETIITNLSQNVETTFIQQDMDIRIAPRFYEIVKQPMSLHDIITKLNNAAYTEYEQVVQDFRRIFHNVRLYLKSCPDPTMKKNIYKVSSEFEKLLNEEFNTKSDSKDHNYSGEKETKKSSNKNTDASNVKFAEDTK